jgi:cytochrome c biogenesis protein CcmG/thiol:disulfide interchange protein DsbE
LIPSRDRPRRAGTGARLAPFVSAIAVIALASTMASAASAPFPLERSAAPAFSLRSVAGEKLSLAKLLAKGPVVLDFWATWCHPCLAELPELEALHKKYAERGLTVVGISVDGPRNFARVRPFASRAGLTFPIAIDEDGRIQQLFQVRAMPTTLLIDTSGVIVTVREGYRPGDTSRLEAAIAELFQPPPSEAPKR